MEELTLTITGMDCANCAKTVENGVSQLDGVTACRVNFATEQLHVTGQVADTEVVTRVRALGYDVRTPDSTTDETPATNFFAFLWQRPTTRLALAAGLLILPAAILTEILGIHHWLLDGAALVALALAGWPIAQSGWRNARINRSLNINALMTIAALGALVIGAFVEAGMVMVLFAIGEALEGYTAGRARNAIRSLMQLAPSRALRLQPDGTTATVDVGALAVGDRIVIKPGARMPMDGVVLAGITAVNQAPITGESVPVDKTPGDPIYAGSINGTGALEVEVTKLAADNTISRIVRLVQEAQASQAPSQRMVDRFAAVYTPAVVVLAAVVAVAPPLLFGQPFFNPADGSFGWLYRGLALLVVACPCALVISTPVSVISAISNAAQRGILIKGGAILERLATIRQVAFDKTGTLTTGHPSVIDVRTTACSEPAPDNCPACDDVLALASALEARSEHPFAQAVVAEAHRRGVDQAYGNGVTVTALVGRGVSGQVGDHAVLVGSHAHFDADIPHAPEVCRAAEADAGQGFTPIMVGKDGHYLGTITLADTIRPGAAAAVQALRDAGITRIVMLTGDNETTAKSIAAQVGVDHVEAGLLPEEKTTAVQTLRGSGPVAMIGDGINDAPALATADVGIAMAAGGGTAQAMETADVTLMNEDLGRVAQLFRLSRATVATIRFNILFSIGIKVLFMLAVLAGVGTMWMAVAADMGTSLLVTLNGMRLLRWNSK